MEGIWWFWSEFLWTWWYPSDGNEPAIFSVTMVTDEQSRSLAYVDLSLNPERYTGYAGPSADRIWKAIYRENCFLWVKYQFLKINTKYIFY